MYKILESRIEFKDNQIHKITVLVDCTGANSKPLTDVRAIYATRSYGNYHSLIDPSAKLNEELLQKIAAYGHEDYNRDKIFPKWKSNQVNFK